MMAKIYSRAERVLIWLGEETEDVKTSFASIIEAHSLFVGDDVEFEGPDHSNSELLLTIFNFDWQRIANLIKRSWFTRKWVIQEVAFAREAVLLCGDSLMSWEVFGDLVSHLRENDALGFVATEDDTDPHHLPLGKVFTIAYARQNVLMDIRISLPSLLFYSRDFRCTNPRDHIFALLSVVSPDPELQAIIVDYTTDVKEVFKQFVIREIVEKSSLDILVWASIQSITSEHLLPSWVPDFANIVPAPFNTSVTLFSASANSIPHSWFSDHDKILHLTGKIIDRAAGLALTREEVERKACVENGRLYPDPISALSLVNMRVWYHGCKTIAGDLSSPDRYEEFWRTMICDIARSAAFRAPKEYSEHLKRFDLFLENPVDDRASLIDIEEKFPSMHIASVCLSQSYSTGRFCCTTRGRLAVAPATTEVGDVICIFYAAHVPYVLRPVGDAGSGHFNLLGPCYVHGLMDGEAMKMEDLETMEFALV